MAFTTYAANALLNHMFGGTTYTQPAAVYLALFSTATNDAGGGTELTGNGYSRVTLTMAASSSKSKATSAQIQFTASGGTLGGAAVTHCAIMDASTAGNMLIWLDIADATISDTGTYTFASGAISIALT